MDMVKGEWKKNLIKTWRRCRSHLGNNSSDGSKKSPKFVTKYLKRSKTWHCTTTTTTKSSQVAPNGCFSVYVGSEKQRFVIKTEFANHPLFKVLLEDAELEYGFNSDGPILLPCDVGFFYKVLSEIIDDGDDDEIDSPSMIPCSPLCTPVNRGYRLLSPSRFIKLN